MDQKETSRELAQFILSDAQIHQNLSYIFMKDYLSFFSATDLIDLRMNIDKTTKDLQDKVFGIYSRIRLLRS